MFVKTGKPWKDFLHQNILYKLLFTIFFQYFFLALTANGH